MRWTSRARAAIGQLTAVIAVVMVACWPFVTQQHAQPQPEQKQLTVYSPQTTYNLPVTTRDNRDYIGLVEVLEPLGTINAKLEGNRWKLRFDNREAQFTSGALKARVHKTDIDLGAPFIMENGRGLVPIHVLPQILTELRASKAVELHEPGRRLFLGKVEVRYAAELKQMPTAQIVLSFSVPVNPVIATEAGKLRMTFRREPLVTETPGGTVAFDSKPLASLVYSENNGTAELTVNSLAPLTAIFSTDRRTITVAPLSAPAVAVTPSTLPAVGQIPNLAAPSGPPRREFLVVIDPAHGGDDRGGVITDKLAEKEVALAFSRRLSGELQTHGIATRLLRDGDVALTAEARVAAANGAVPSLFLSIHAAASGSGVHLFSANIPAVSKPSPFLPWETAQAAYVNASHTVATGIATELLKHDIPALDLKAPVASLDSIAAPALAIEIAPPQGGVQDKLTAPQYQQSVCSAIAVAIAEARGRLPRGKVAER